MGQDALQKVNGQTVTSLDSGIEFNSKKREMLKWFKDTEESSMHVAP